MTLSHGTKFIFDDSLKDTVKKAKINQYKISYNNYNIVRNEYSFLILNRIDQLSSFAKRPIRAFSKTFINMPSEKKMEEERLAKFKNYFLLHQYQFIDQATQEKDIPDEIKIYVSKYHISLAKFSGFEIENPDHEKLPCIITERPVNGSLFSYYQTILNQAAFNTDSSTEFNTSSDSEDNFNLNTHFSNKIQELSLEEKYILIVGITAGIEFLHSLGLVHGRLNPHNIYLNEFLQAKICGYGFIKPKKIKKKNEEKEEDEEDEEEEEELEEDGPICNFGVSNIHFAFNSPEVLKGIGIYQSSDIYSLGMLIYYILSEIEPFNNLKPLQQQKKIYDGLLPSFPESINDQWSALIASCCQKDHKYRPTARNILSKLLIDERHNNLLSSLFEDSSNFTQEQRKYLLHIKTSFNFDSELYDNEIVLKFIPDPTILKEKYKKIIAQASKGDPESLYLIAGYFLKGHKNFPKDKYSAFSFYKKAADLNHPQSVKKVADLHYKGIGTKINTEEALKYYKKALELDQSDTDRDIIIQNIKAINEKEEPSFKKVLEEPPEEDEFAMHDSEAIRLRQRERKEKEKRTIQLRNFSSSTTNADISKIFSRYKINNIIIYFVSTARFDYANVYFYDIEDKNRFLRLYKRKNKIIKVRDRIIKVYNENTIVMPGSRLSSVTPKSKSKPKPKPLNLSEPSKPKPELDINLDDFYPGKGKSEYENIGKGAFSHVYKIYDKEDKVYVAKVLNKGIEDSNERKCFFREIDALTNIQHPLIIKFYGVNHYSIINRKLENATMIMEYAPNKTIGYVIDQNPKNPYWTDTTKMKCIIGIAYGMAYLHKNDYVHRDLKPDNIFLDDNFEPKIGDLGTSRKIDQSNELVMTINVGTPYYMAPELFECDTIRYLWEVDVYSFGITMYQIITGVKTKDLYNVKGAKTRYGFFKNVLKGLRPTIPDDMHNDLKIIIERCWASQIDNRPSFRQIYDFFDAAFQEENPPKYLPNIDINLIKKYLAKLNRIND